MKENTCPAETDPITQAGTEDLVLKPARGLDPSGELLEGYSLSVNHKLIWDIYHIG